MNGDPGEGSLRAVIYVCSLFDMPGCVAAARPSHLVSLLPPEELPGTPPGIPSDQHLRLGLDDISEPAPGLVLPHANHVDELVEFVAGWTAERPLVVHCFAGISRSMAAALIVLAMAHEGREAAAAQWLRRHAPHAQPNRRMVALADRALDRDGRLIAAREAMGTAALVLSGPVVRVPVAISS